MSALHRKPWSADILVCAVPMNKKGRLRAGPTQNGIEALERDSRRDLEAARCEERRRGGSDDRVLAACEVAAAFDLRLQGGVRDRVRDGDRGAAVGIRTDGRRLDADDAEVTRDTVGVVVSRLTIQDVEDVDRQLEIRAVHERERL